MPYKKKLIKKSKLSPVVIAYLSDDQTSVFTGPDSWVLGCFRHGSPAFDEDPKELWEKYHDDFLPEFIRNHPGRRPLPWWQWVAPREPVSTWDEEQFNSAQRLRLGGTGTPLHEISCIWGGFVKGIPGDWVSEDYKKAGFDGVVLDGDDPPLYESEATYLLRHGLLSSQEKKFLQRHLELMEPEKVLFDEDEKGEQ
jgi:hypothetical protein